MDSFSSCPDMLTGKQKRFLRALATNIDPIVQVGKQGLTENVMFSLNEALEARELVKIKVLKNCMEETKDVAEEITEKSAANLVQVVGRNIVLYRPNKDNPQITLPK